MPSRDPIQRFEDILENIALIEEFTRDMDQAAFLDDLKTRNATERCLERISEAAKKLGELAEELCPTVPWPNVRALGNFLRHEYERVEPGRLWVMVEDDIVPLKAASQRALQQLRQPDTKE
ncbi:MAG: HepT-like ribonuclease domain-containing protein [Candidatus Solibacter sp.]